MGCDVYWVEYIEDGSFGIELLVVMNGTNLD